MRASPTRGTSSVSKVAATWSRSRRSGFRHLPRAREVGSSPTGAATYEVTDDEQPPRDVEDCDRPRDRGTTPPRWVGRPVGCHRERQFITDASEGETSSLFDNRGRVLLTVPIVTACDTTLAPAVADRPLRLTPYVNTAFQFVLGGGFLLSPSWITQARGPSPASGWTARLFGMRAARFLGAGLATAARDPLRHRRWIETMIAVQAVGWIATLTHPVYGDVPIRRVTSMACLPAVFVVALTLQRPRHDTVGIGG